MPRSHLVGERGDARLRQERRQLGVVIGSLSAGGSVGRIGAIVDVALAAAARCAPLARHRRRRLLLRACRFLTRRLLLLALGQAPPPLALSLLPRSRRDRAREMRPERSFRDLAEIAPRFAPPLRRGRVRTHAPGAGPSPTLVERFDIEPFPDFSAK